MDKETIIKHLNNSISGDVDSIMLIVEEFLNNNVPPQAISTIMQQLASTQMLLLQVFSKAVNYMTLTHEINILTTAENKTIKYL